MPGRPKGYYLLAMDRLREWFGGRCVDCGSTRRLEFAHVKPTGLCSRGRGKADRYHDIRKNPDCYALRCRRCHRSWDYRHARGWDDPIPGLHP
jgi:hypothetical protein